MPKREKLKPKGQNSGRKEKKERKTEDKIAIILRGWPGSGKSSFGLFLKKILGKNCALHSVDDLHTGKKGFCWNEEKAEAFYHLNFSNFVISLSQEKPVVLCDCINLKVADFEKYLEAARSFGYRSYVVTPEMPSAQVAAERNLHGVSKKQIDSMVNLWEHWPAKTVEPHN